MSASTERKQREERKQTVDALLDDMRERIESDLECVYSDGVAYGSRIAAEEAFKRGKAQGYEEGFRAAWSARRTNGLA